MEIQKFQRKPFFIQAIQVTAENMEEVSNWAGGEIHTDPRGQFINLAKQVRNPLNPRQTKAFVGDWVLSSRRGVKVYNNSAFKNNFLTAEESVRPKAEVVEEEVASPMTDGGFGFNAEGMKRLTTALSRAADNVFDKYAPEDEPQELLSVTDPKDQISGKRS